MISPLEARLVKNEIALAKLFVPVARAALAANNLKRAEQACVRAQAAYVRSIRLADEGDRPDEAPLSAALRHLQSLIDAIAHPSEP